MKYFARDLYAMFTGRLIAAVALAALSAPSLALANEVSGEAIARVEALFDDEAGALPIGGMTVGVVSGSKLIWTKSYGLADIKSKTPTTVDTVYRIGSITKQFTALMYLQLLDRGIVKEGDPVEAYFPQIKQVKGSPAEIAKISFAELATHRAGLSREPDDLRYLSGPTELWEKTLASAMPHVSIDFAQGDAAHYSNVGYAILGAALEVAAKEPYITYVQSHILQPLAMSHSGFILTADMKSHLATGYAVTSGDGDSDSADKDLRLGRGYKIPNGGLFTTVGDLAKFVSLELGAGPQSVITEHELRAWHSQFYPMPPDATYGIALQKRELAGRIQLGHGGAVAGFVAGAFFDPDAKVGVICLRNTDARYGGCNVKVLGAALATLASDRLKP